MMILNESTEQASLAPASGEAGGVRRQRTDLRTRDLVNQAVASVPTLGLQRAAEFLATMNVPAEVAVRVLVYPSRRRAG
ncbi:hypothetical protein LE190_11240 [Massilia oculi]|uniref:Uncharacterized protein n=1 Tax=Massilia hydrophila TaxID=3044279 RepID=A0ABS7YDS0_9BURK|nr:hypothetical protein [Massilia oculi]MCA1856490.1 hypothetical protein [Massilia oculi]